MLRDVGFERQEAVLVQNALRDPLMRVRVSPVFRYAMSVATLVTTAKEALTAVCTVSEWNETF